MKSNCFLTKSKIILDQEHHNTALYNIELANLARMRIMLVVLFIIELMFIIFNDLPYYLHLKTEIIWQDSGYFILHLLLVVTSLVGFIITRILLKAGEGKWKRVYSYFIPSILVIYLTLVSFLNGLDQSHINRISSIFIANLLICGGIFMIKFPMNLYVYAIPCLSHIGTFIYFEFDVQALYSNLINCLIFLFAVVIISSTIYNYQYEGIAKNIILDKTNSQLSYISNHDPLTDLLNRRCFMEQIDNLQEEQIDNLAKEPAAVILVDVDFFKIVNDKYGHPVGDIVLKEVSSVLVKYIKESDLAVRWGGEEFLLFLYNTSVDEAYVLAELTRKAIQELTIEINGFMIQTTASFGVASIDYEHNFEFSSAYKAADIALYQAKAQGRNRVVKATA